MKIEDCVIETLNCPVSIALSEKQFKRWSYLVNEFKKLPKKPSLREGARIKLDQLMDEAEAILKDYKSKILDLSVLK